MTKFAYIADTHLGADPMGYQQQRGYPERLPELVALLDAWIRDRGDIAYVLHGGDMVQMTSEDNIRGAAELFRLSVPVYLCLGNHDLTEPDALAMWLDLAPELFMDGQPGYSLPTGGGSVHVVPNHWEERPYCWQDEMNARLAPEQLDKLEAAVQEHPKAAHILATHSPVLGVPPEQTGFDDPYHVPPESFSGTVLDLVRRRPRIRCVLSAHSHVNMHVIREGAHFVTAGAFPETPFEFKLFEVGPEVLKMSTVSLVSQVGFTPEYDHAKAWVQGREQDRQFEEPL